MEKLKDIRAVITDWDDTTVATFPYIVDLIDSFAEQQDLPKPGRDGVSLHWGKPRHLLIASLWPDMDPDEINDLYLASVPSDFIPYPFGGIEEAVLKLLDMGYVVGIVSSGSSRYIRRTLERHYPLIRDRYHFIHGSEDYEHYKPDPRVFDPAFKLLNELGITEREALYSGDSLGDYYAACNRGLPFVATTTGYTIREKFIEAGISEAMIVDSFCNVSDLLALYR